MNKKTTATLLALGMGLGITLTMSLAMTPEPTGTLPPCPTEDSTNCIWDATTQGNGAGTDFVDLDGTAYYPDTDPGETDTDQADTPDATDDTDAIDEVNTNDAEKAQPVIQAPAEKAPPANHESPSQGVEEETWPGMDEGTLKCGKNAKPAIDYNDEDGWWAYCEPALID